MLNFETCTDPVRQFADAIYRDTGAIVDPIPDGRIHRFNDPEGKARNGACWYVLHIDGLPAGGYGNWRTGVSITWRASVERSITPEERERANKVVEAAKASRVAQRAREQAQAEERAAVMWEAAVPATVDHSYLAAKGIYALGLRQSGNALLVPLQTIDGDLVNLQTIDPAGNKLFLKGGKVAGTFCLTGGTEIPQEGTLHIAEGLATAATIAKALRAPVVAAMNAGNLLPVSLAIRAHFPRLAIVVAADNDWRTEGNPGIAKAREAAAAVGGTVTWPTVCMKDGCQCTDFNDWESCKGVAQ